MSARTFGPVDLHHGDCLKVLEDIAAAGVKLDGCVTDPPYHLTSIVERFGKEGSAPTKGKDQFKRIATGFMGQQWDGGDIAFRPETWAAVKAVLKPGAYLTAFASTRGYHRMVCAIEDAGFIIHPMMVWAFGTGFPKATRVKAPDCNHLRYGLQALKPALEPICLAQVPMEGTGTQNWLKYGVGALDIDASRIPHSGDGRCGEGRSTGSCWSPGRTNGGSEPEGARNELGRWPANLIHDGSDQVVSAFPESDGQQRDTGPEFDRNASVYGKFAGVSAHTARGDSGSAARFFYSAKADADDRWGSKHPTVKPVDLIRWLVGLTIPPGGAFLDPFAGSGTAGAAAIAAGRRAILIERDDGFHADITARLEWLTGSGAHRSAAKARHAPETDAGPLFGNSEAVGGGQADASSTGPSRPTNRPDRIEALT